MSTCQLMNVIHCGHAAQSPAKFKLPLPETHMALSIAGNERNCAWGLLISFCLILTPFPSIVDLTKLVTAQMPSQPYNSAPLLGAIREEGAWKCHRPACTY